jgi:hypothetical protein
LTVSLRFVVALFATVLFVAGPLVQLGWVAGQSMEYPVCLDTPPNAPYRNATETFSSADWWPPRVTCTYRLRDRVIVVRHDAPHRGAAAALMAMALVLAIAAYAAPGRKLDEATAAHG